MPVIVIIVGNAFGREMRLFRGGVQKVVVPFATWAHGSIDVCPVSIIAKVAGFPFLYPNHGDVHTVSGVDGAAHVLNMSGIGVVGVEDISALTFCNWSVVASWEAYYFLYFSFSFCCD